MSCEPIPLGQRGQQITETLKVQTLLLERGTESVRDETEIAHVFEEVCDRPLECHGGKTAHHGHVTSIERASPVAELGSLRLATRRRDELVALRPQIADSMEPRCGGPRDYDVVRGILQATLSESLRLGAEPGGVKVLELVARSTCVFVDTMRKTFKVPGFR